ncbi:hypothetical protein BU15DRAFT_63515 [Melanogaster broomeanus]|nr:hypothetical protein BU15DRAFT_63515 [Melanogaster broomeanus]
MAVVTLYGSASGVSPPPSSGITGVPLVSRARRQPPQIFNDPIWDSGLSPSCSAVARHLPPCILPPSSGSWGFSSAGLQVHRALLACTCRVRVARLLDMNDVWIGPTSPSGHAAAPFGPWLLACPVAALRLRFVVGRADIDVRVLGFSSGVYRLEMGADLRIDLRVAKTPFLLEPVECEIVYPKNPVLSIYSTPRVRVSTRQVVFQQRTRVGVTRTGHSVWDHVYGTVRVWGPDENPYPAKTVLRLLPVFGVAQRPGNQDTMRTHNNKCQCSTSPQWTEKLPTTPLCAEVHMQRTPSSPTADLPPRQHRLAQSQHTLAQPRRYSDEAPCKSRLSDELGDMDTGGKCSTIPMAGHVWNQIEAEQQAERGQAPRRSTRVQKVTRPFKQDEGSDRAPPDTVDRANPNQCLAGSKRQPKYCNNTILRQSRIAHTITHATYCGVALLYCSIPSPTSTRTAQLRASRNDDYINASCQTDKFSFTSLMSPLKRGQAVVKDPWGRRSIQPPVPKPYPMSGYGFIPGAGAGIDCSHLVITGRSGPRPWPQALCSAGFQAKHQDRAHVRPMARLTISSPSPGPKPGLFAIPIEACSPNCLHQPASGIQVISSETK